MTLARIKKIAPIGCEIDDSKCGESHSCEVIAPPGMVWTDTGTHSIVDSAWRPWKPDYVDLLSRMSGGVEPCTDSDCDWCNNR